MPPGCAGAPGTMETCGGPTAPCIAENGGQTGYSSICASGRSILACSSSLRNTSNPVSFSNTGQCENGSCAKGAPIGVGLPCSDATDCFNGIWCNNDFCTGGELSCKSDIDVSYRTGPAKDCYSGFCRQGRCSNLPTAKLGDTCVDSNDCAGNSEARLLNCGEEKFGVKRCGGVGAKCSTAEGGTGSTPELCISGEQLRNPRNAVVNRVIGQCSNFACVDVAPSPGVGKRVLPQKHLTERVCPAGFEPCPISSRGYEVRTILSRRTWSVN